jgi:DNA-binding PadR family transcriptional regulator
MHHRFGKGFFDDDGLSHHRFGMARKLVSADLRLLILALLAQQPAHGYEIIKVLDERSQGFYVPSPGMVYPALTHLEQRGYASIAADGRRKRYQIRPDGRQVLAADRAKADALFAQFRRGAARMVQLRAALDARGGSPELRDARRELQRALSEKWHSSRDEQLRVADILNRAATEILGNQTHS